MSPRPIREKLACMLRPRSTRSSGSTHAHVDGGGIVEARRRRGRRCARRRGVRSSRRRRDGRFGAVRAPRRAARAADRLRRGRPRVDISPVMCGLAASPVTRRSVSISTLPNWLSSTLNCAADTCTFISPTLRRTMPSSPIATSRSRPSSLTLESIDEQSVALEHEPGDARWCSVTPVAGTVKPPFDVSTRPFRRGASSVPPTCTSACI